MTALWISLLAVAIVAIVILVIRTMSQQAAVVRAEERLSLLREESEREKQRVAQTMGDLQLHSEEMRQRLEQQIAAEKLRSAELKEYYEQQLNDEKRRDTAFKAMAAEVMNNQAEQLRQQQQSSLKLILQPFKDEIEGFRKVVADTYAEESRQRFSLAEHIRQLVEANNNIGREAKELTRALRGNSKVQGDWGEMILESILEKSGLKAGEEFTVQQTVDADGRPLASESGARLRPDVVLHYPSRGDVVIDSKVSLKDYIDYINATDDDMRSESVSNHVRSVRSHIKELRDKSYQDYVKGNAGGRTLDFVMMFIPNEGAYMTALTAEPGLWEEGLESRVLIVSPTHLVSVLSMIHQLWNENRQNRNAIEIAESAGRMYEKFVGFVGDMEKIKKGIDATEKAYGDAINKLRDGRGSLMSRAENLRELGAKTTKQLKGYSTEK